MRVAGRRSSTSQGPGRPQLALKLKEQQRDALVKHYADGSMDLENLWPSDWAVELFTSNNWDLPALLQVHAGIGGEGGRGEGGGGGCWQGRGW